MIVEISKNEVGKWILNEWAIKYLWDMKGIQFSQQVHMAWHFNVHITQQGTLNTYLTSLRKYVIELGFEPKSLWLQSL